MAAIPKSLTNYGEILKGAESLKQITVEHVRLLPNNQPSSQVYSPEATNSIYFRVPNFSNSFLDSQESFLQFDFKIVVGSGDTTSDSLALKLVDWCPLFNRIVVKTSNGLVIQDTSNAHILSKLFNLMSTETHSKISEADYSDFNVTNAKGKVGQLQQGKEIDAVKKPVTYVMRFNSGVLNTRQALPIGLMGTSFALDFELYLSTPEQCLETIGNTSAFTKRSYELSNVCYNTKLLKLSEDLMRKYNMIMNSNQELVVPITVMRIF